MGQHTSMIVAAARRAKGYADKLTVGVTPQIAARKPRFESAGKTVLVDTNHPSFVFGHLALYPARMFTFAGLDPAPVAAPKGWDEILKAGVQCQDDEKGTIYPAWPTLLAQFNKAYDAAFATIEKLDDKVLGLETPDARAREFFPTVGVALTFMLNDHVMMHMGQVSAWRRCFGLPSAM